MIYLFIYKSAEPCVSTYLSNDFFFFSSVPFSCLVLPFCVPNLILVEAASWSESVRWEKTLSTMFTHAHKNREGLLDVD